MSKKIESKRVQKGFTLIELLVVIAIIGLLASIALVALNGARAKGRDARRKEDIRQLATALQLYYHANQTYPSETWCDSSIGLQDGVGCPVNPAQSDWDYTTVNRIGRVLREQGIMQNLPKDPINNSSYYYEYEPECNAGVCVGKGCCYYRLTARLEGGGNFLLQGY